MPKNDMRIAIWDILSRFLRKYEREDGHFATLRDKVYETYQPNFVDADTLHTKLCRDNDVEMRDQHLFLYFNPIESKKIVPLVTLQSSGKWDHFRIYTLLTMLDEKSELKALALRFETDEGGRRQEGEIGSHDFCHAQLCNSIGRRIRASTPPWFPDSQPSIPLDADNQVSLVLCMLTSLYGGAYVRRRFNASDGKGLQKHLNKVRALRASTTTN